MQEFGASVLMQSEPKLSLSSRSVAHVSHWPHQTLFVKTAPHATQQKRAGRQTLLDREKLHDFTPYRAGLIGSGISTFAIGRASAADYPARPVRWIVGYPPGGATDIIARLVGQRLSEKLGQQFVIENKPGAGNNIGTEAAINAEPDGYTVLLVNPANYINASLYANLKFNFVRDVAPVASFNRVPNVMTVNKDVPAKNVAEFIEYVKANPRKVNMASSGNGTSVHLSGEMFMSMTGCKMQHVPYRGAAPAITDMLGGQVQVIFDNMPSIIQHIRSGSLRALGVTTTERSSRLPDVPAIAETVKGYEASALFGMGAPEEHAEGADRQAQQRDQRRSCRTRHAQASGRARRRLADRDAGRLRQRHQGRDRQMEEGGRVRRPQGRVDLARLAARGGPSGTLPETPHFTNCGISGSRSDSDHAQIAIDSACPCNDDACRCGEHRACIRRSL